MESNDIIKALEECIELRFDDTEYATVRLDTLTNALDLITQQQAEYENLKVENQSLRSAANSLKMHYEEAQAEIERLKQRNAVCEAANRCIVWQRDRRDREIEELHSQIAGLNIYKSKIKAEAYKECLAKVKNYIKTHCNPYGKPDFDYDTSIKILNFIDNLKKRIGG